MLMSVSLGNPVGGRGSIAGGPHDDLLDLDSRESI
jgi:hypothetical protein